MVRRQSTSAAKVPEDAGRSFRLDPFQLPARVDYLGATRAGTTPQTAVVSPDRVTIRRMTGAGAPLYVGVPLSAYRGVLLSVRSEGGSERISLKLHHPNDELAVPLFEADDMDDVVADWQAWGRMLARPLLIEQADGAIAEPYERLGSLVVKRPRARRANRFFAERRPRMLCSRRVGGRSSGLVHRDDEIIARAVED